MATGSKAASTVAGKAKSVAKALEGYPGIFHHLAGEHAEVAALMERVAHSSEDASVREELFPEIRKSLLAHAHAEEEEFYAALRGYSEIESLVSQCLDEHHKVEEYLGELESGNKATKTWSELFGRMKRAVEAHVEREEQELFPKARELLGDERASEMEKRYESAEEREKKSL